MKIAAVNTHLLEYRLPVPFESASMRFDRRAHMLVEIVCDDGTIGWGECLGPARPNAAVVAAYTSRLIGADPLETEKIWAVLYNALRDQGQRGLSITALSGIDIALWDIKGKHFGVPISTLLGGRFRKSVRAYATGSFKRDGVDRIEDNANEMGTHAKAGFHAVKIKIGFDVEEDLRVIRAVREAIGPHTRLMIDANHGYDVIEAVSLGKRAAEYGIDWFEEPVVPEQLGAYRAVRAGQPIPVAGGETWHTRWGMQEPIKSRAIDIIQPDLCGVGGITEARRIADMAALHGVRVVPHVWGTAVHIAAALQFMASMIPNPVRVNPIEPILEFDRTDNPFRQAVITTPIEHVDGVVAIPDGPGLGIEIDRAALAEFRMGDD
ncbi:mandelate racemase/muconate lactonizing enzyme family protein [Rhizobium sp. VS19-DR104.2]|uniref:mandelate racemase/muconate lactonizing enzyme family protein n=1 Tax=unclassified Rhizobium TaxID=2613769 RepID=UPI001CC5DF56|nr:MULTISPECIES: mandelate racemase/muconate lactonizing enzyme family protein [unclassified Rhizobium]MBZ5762654.1 mandelate racemase/muconate lactonizing enzyme family protein [Rhizobium sp. VS19-DR96]MBZ5768132.1 mandelate racemase/muconate lactonizing enzyme family protein [Rhizobium sp. VS19-DR129.2]MBZ5775498.1 mandelate racemase/muconate lactonizing enzyme family protein [Rhizobium sp. VS19-DRK62.2]MBZ5787384.1 mandelate racemase/muconate lactonizing enzyme family protein [Rhizobium sp. 